MSAVLIWVPRLPSLGLLNRVAGVLAGASLYIYMVHWQVYPRLEEYSRVLALVAALLAGIACAAATSHVRGRLSVHIRRFGGFLRRLLSQSRPSAGSVGLSHGGGLAGAIRGDGSTVAAAGVTEPP